MSSQSYDAIRVAVFDHLEQTSGKKVASNHKLATHIGQSDSALADYVSTLNRLPLFRSDGLFLASGRIPPSANVDQLLNAIVHNYRERGWLITLP